MKFKLLIMTLAITVNINAKDAVWVSPSKASCKSEHGQVDSKGVCKAKWEDAKNICAADVARLPTIDELSQEVKKCKKTANDNKSIFINHFAVLTGGRQFTPVDL